MRLRLILGVCLTIPFWSCWAQTNETALLDAFSHIPACAQACIISTIPESPCKTFNNTECICTDQALKDATQRCLLNACSVPDILTAGKVQADACNTPLRSEKAALMGPLAIEVLAIPAVLLRLYSRWKYTAGYEVDDWIMIACLPIFIVFEVVGHLSGQLGFGVDVWRVEPATFSYALKLFYIDESFYLAVLVLTKISILFFYLRIFPQDTFRWACYGVMLWVGLSGTAFVAMQIFQCDPIAYVWEGWLLSPTTTTTTTTNSGAPHHCLDVHALAYTAAAFSIAQDVAILALPLPLLWRLNTGLRQRVDIGVMFSLGFFILLTSCIRLGFMVRFADSFNPARDYVGPMVWSGLECGVSMVVTSLPAIRTLLTRTFAGAASASKPSNHTSQGSSSRARSGLSGRKGVSSWSMFSTKAGSQVRNVSEVELGHKDLMPNPLKTDAISISGAEQWHPSTELRYYP